jgi:hypothetical protein
LNQKVLFKKKIILLFVPAAGASAKVGFKGNFGDPFRMIHGTKIRETAGVANHVARIVT